MSLIFFSLYQHYKKKISKKRTLSNLIHRHIVIKLFGKFLNSNFSNETYVKMKKKREREAKTRRPGSYYLQQTVRRVTKALRVSSWKFDNANRIYGRNFQQNCQWPPSACSWLRGETRRRTKKKEEEEEAEDDDWDVPGPFTPGTKMGMPSADTNIFIVNSSFLSLWLALFTISVT